MTYQISDKCIGCGSCIAQCPTGAISQQDNGKYAIEANLCNDCTGSYGVAQCMAVCPTQNACTPTLSTVMRSAQTVTATYWDQWFNTYEQLTTKLRAKQETQYWNHWFDQYSQKLERLILSH